MCHLCGKCKKVGISFGDCMIVPKFIFVPSTNGGGLKETSKIERKLRKTVDLAKSLLIG